VRDNIGGHTFDLSALNISGGYHVSGHGVMTVVNVCGGVPCGHLPNASVGACTAEDPSGATTPELLGLASRTLMYNHGDVYLHYNTSAPCGVDDDGNAAVVQTKIFFVCDPAATVELTTSASADEYVALISTTGGCEFIYEYQTALACPPAAPRPCVVQDPTSGAIYNLAPLTLPTGSWPVTVGETTYSINVCAPEFSTNCNPSIPGQAACQYTSAGGSFGLGMPSTPRLGTVNGEQQLFVEYVGGDYCHVTSTTRHTRSSYITFYCDEDNGLGEVSL
jgi:hypothetical protein